MNKNMMKQAQQLQAKLLQIQTELETLTVNGSSGGGVINIEMTGKQEVKNVTIDPDTVDDIDLLQDLILTAINDAVQKSQQLASDKMGAVTGGLNIPGLT
ncbi:MAG TPA: YbaB/EbfC family nucleoid-associated protein [Dehalococcoidia bacterium]|jgi:nucleoid-associated protein EbfC|nr:YbaB/EbfC family nucleoid-associated protein [Dehalococcoidia bacterium]|tara:strand:+ start:224 stop:523 length:300 start_codon:yes stop_codon:yes gene_type:complete